MAQTTDARVERSGFIKHISWGAIFGGVVVVLATQMMLSLLGISFGAGSINPLEETNPMAGLGLGSAIWFGLATLLALFAGGWVSGRLASLGSPTDSALHGVLTWGLSTLVVTYLLTSAVGGILSGTAGIIGQTASMVGQSAKWIAPEIAKAVGMGADDGATWASVKSEVQTLLKQTKKQALQPKAMERMADNTAADAQSAASGMAQDPARSGDEFASLLAKIEARGDRVIEAADADAIANILVAKTDLNKDQARAAVSRWQKVLVDAKQKVAALSESARQNVRQVADSAAGTVSTAAAWTFISLLLGLAAAAGGGYLSSLPPLPRGRRFESFSEKMA